MGAKVDIVNDHGKLKGANAKDVPATIVGAVSLIFIGSLYSIGLAALTLVEAHEMLNGNLINNINIVIDQTSTSTLEAELLAHGLYATATYALITGVLGAILGYLVLTGREWARIAASVLFGVALVAALGRLVGTTHLLWIEVIYVVASAAIIWALWSSESTAFFRRHSAATEAAASGDDD